MGFQIGSELGERLQHKIKNTLATIRDQYGLPDFAMKQALPFLDLLPKEHVNELQGIADATNCAMEMLAAWVFSDMFMDGCSSMMIKKNERLWIARNNDYLFPKQWNFLIEREIEGYIPFVQFSLEGDPYSGTGFNQTGLWLHYNWLPNLGKDGLQGRPAYVLLRMMLERCHNLQEVETFLSHEDFRGGFVLFVGDGKHNLGGVYECVNGSVKKKTWSENDTIMATNHYTEHSQINMNAQNSIQRYQCMQYLVEKNPFKQLPADLITILADTGVEQCNGQSGTVYACVVCPSKKAIWYSCDEFPAASKGTWVKLEWPWS